MNKLDKKIRILIVDDSDVIAYLLREIFNKQSDMVVVGHARNGEEAVKLAVELKPSIITMDIRMPKMDGFEATHEIMTKNPTPIIIISSSIDSIELNITFNALEEGALMVFEKPGNIESSNFQKIESDLINAIRVFSGMHVMRRRDIHKVKTTSYEKNSYKLVALGVSTGGPAVLNFILKNLPAAYPVPIVIVQHMAKNFLVGLVKWLDDQTLLHVKLVENGEHLKAGTVYFAPDELHLHIISKDGEPYAKLVSSPPVDFFRPSITELFSSISTSFPGKAIAGLLTGMGRDGAAGLLSMRHQKCQTFVQNQESSVVYGMPGAAIELKATNNVIPLSEIPYFLIKNV